MGDLCELQDLNPPPGDETKSTGLYEDSWMWTVFEEWNHIVSNFGIVAQELCQNQVGFAGYKFVNNQTISKLQGAL
jgi:hypothetical protein